MNEKEIIPEAMKKAGRPLNAGIEASPGCYIPLHREIPVF